MSGEMVCIFVLGLGHGRKVCVEIVDGNCSRRLLWNLGRLGPPRGNGDIVRDFVGREKSGGAVCGQIFQI
jgi:hypothetical protein